VADHGSDKKGDVEAHGSKLRMETKEDGSEFIVQIIKVFIHEECIIADIFIAVLFKGIDAESNATCLFY
jgi:hypothetical protein